MKKTPAVLLLSVLLLFFTTANAQSEEYYKWYFGADFGISKPLKITESNFKSERTNVNHFQMAVKGGVRIIAVGHENGIRYLIETEVRGDNWQNRSLKGTFFSLLGGLEYCIGDKGYIHLLAGPAIGIKDSGYIRPNIGLRIGNGQLYIQPVYMPVFKNAKSFYPSMFNLTVGLKSFTYAGVREKPQYIY